MFTGYGSFPEQNIKFTEPGRRLATTKHDHSEAGDCDNRRASQVTTGRRGRDRKGSEEESFPEFRLGMNEPAAPSVDSRRLGAGHCSSFPHFPPFMTRNHSFTAGHCRRAAVILK